MSTVAAEAAPAPSANRRFAAANAIDALGSGIFVPVSLLYFIATTPLSTVRIGLALTLASLLSIPFGPPIGTLVDRFGARPVLLAANALQAVGFAGVFSRAGQRAGQGAGSGVGHAVPARCPVRLGHAATSSRSGGSTAP